MNSKDIIKCLEQEGWYKVGDKSDHEKYKHPEKSDHVVVPRPRKDMPIGTLCNIFDILPDLKDGDSSCETLMSERKNIQCWVYISIMERTALHALPFSYS